MTTYCTSCWREAPNGGHCDTCTKGECLGAPSKLKAWDGSHPPPAPEERKDTMTVTAEEIETAFSSAEPIPVAELERGVGPLYWYGLGYRRAAGVYSAGPGEVSPVAAEALQPNDMGVIRAAEGVVLEPGEYDSIDPTGASRFKTRKRIPVYRSNSGVWAWNVSALSFPMVTAVRRVEPERYKPKVGDTVRVISPAGSRYLGKTGTVLSLEHGVELRIHGEEPKASEVYPAFPEHWVERVEPDQSERPILVGSTWFFNGNEERVILALDPIEVGIPGPIRTPHGTWKDEVLFRKLYTWVSDPAPKADPSAPEAEGCRKHHLIHCSACQEERYLRSVERERDAAVARITEIEARQLNTDAGMNTLRKQHEELEREHESLTRQLAHEQKHRAMLANDLSALIDGKEVTTHLASVVRKKHVRQLNAARFAAWQEGADAEWSARTSVQARPSNPYTKPLGVDDLAAPQSSTEPTP